MNKFKTKYLIGAIIVFIFAVGFALVFRGKGLNPPQLIKTANDKVSQTQPASDNPSAIEALRKRTYTGSQVTIEKTLISASAYTSYLISYKSDNLKIYGVMNVPNGNSPFPVIILNHGYFRATAYSSGDGTQNMAVILAQNGYLTLASDYRGFGGSDDEVTSRAGGHRPDYAIDVLNLIASVKNIKEADGERIGMWGHSMGGEVSLRVAEVSNNLKGVVLWAPTSARASENLNFYSGRHNPTVSPISSLEDGTSPINYLQYIQTPISLHQGLADTEVRPEWSKNLNDELKKENKSVEYYEYPGQDHNFRNLGWDTIAKRTVDFFDKYVKGGENS